MQKLWMKDGQNISFFDRIALSPVPIVRTRETLLKTVKKPTKFHSQFLIMYFIIIFYTASRIIK